MAAVESMAAGKPVIVAAAGGLVETVVDGETGVWLPPAPTPEDLARAVSALDANAANGLAEACRERAEHYSTARFLTGMEEAFQHVRGL